LKLLLLLQLLAVTQNQHSNKMQNRNVKQLVAVVVGVAVSSPAAAGTVSLRPSMHSQSTSCRPFHLLLV
jgi:hypothetical protein